MEVEPDPRWAEVSRGPSRESLEGHALVLQAVGIPSTIAAIDDGCILLVADDDAGRAREQLDAFVRENRDWPRPPVSVPVLSPGVGGALVYAALLVILDRARAAGSYGIDWMRAGAADAAQMCAGAWWRAVTALGLHTDLEHLGGNILFGAVFGVMLAQSVGTGFAWLTFIVAGGAGNMANAFLQAPGHTAVGASTGVFGLLGAQVMFDALRRRGGRAGALRRWAPLVMGAALLAWLGVGGERTDVGAHLCGFAAGLVCGGAAAWRLPARLVTPGAQEATGAIAVAIAAAAWWLALTRG